MVPSRKDDGGLVMSGWVRREPVLIACVRDAGAPRPEDLERLGRRIWEEVQGRCAPPWPDLSPTSAGYRRTMRLAIAAVQGCSDGAEPRRG